MEVIAKILFALNLMHAVVLSAALTDPYCALSNGSFVNNSLLFTFIFIVNTVYLYILISKFIPGYTIIFGKIFNLTMPYIFLHLIILVLNIITIINEFPLNISADKFSHLALLFGTCIYFVFVLVILIKDPFSKKKQVV